ncbi:MAG: Ig-like domain-containing protein, partial [Cytophagales bacterium]
MKGLFETFCACLIGIYVANAQTTTVELISQGSSWKYLDDGSNQGTAWRASSFNDGSWKTGLAELGYGDGDESTIVSFGSSSSSKFITTYFRRAFNISNLSELSNFVLSVKRDDGIVVYVNGTERYRNNMPTGTISSSTLAAADASDDGKTWFSTNLSASHFVNGINVIAVEIHQRSRSSSDISFDLRLSATRTQVDTQPPLLTGTSPANEAISVANNSNLVMTFNENVTKGTGSITIKENGTVKQTISVTSTSVVVNGNTVTISPSVFTLGSTVNVEMPSGVIKDLAGFNYEGITNSTAWRFTVQSQSTVCNKIACFTSVQPGSQIGTLVLPSTHTFQMLFKQGNSYTSGGTAPTGFDFTGYVPKSGSSTSGYVSINHENSPGGVSILDVSYNSSSKLWTRNNAYPVSFSSLVKTERNCSGTVTPWGTIITSEETTASGDANSDGYQDVGWHVEIDPVTRNILQYGTGKAQKLWAMGRMSHE